MSVYEAADWGAKLAGVALVRKDAQGTIFVDEVRVEAVRVIGQFSVLDGVDGLSRVVLTSFLRLVPDLGRASPRDANHPGGDQRAQE
ncbi:MAG: hypothetical protein HGA45_19170 [Chloroflexales bacterium]|nr:hypothetical protein [Chloroflexales bacterium]